MGNGLWGVLNSLTGPTVCKLSNNLDALAYYIFAEIERRTRLPNPPPVPPDHPSDSGTDDDGATSREIGRPVSKAAAPIAPTASSSIAQSVTPPIASSSRPNSNQPPPNSSSTPSPSPNLPLIRPIVPIPSIPRPLAIVKPIMHFLFEVAPYEETEKRWMLSNIVTSSQPIKTFLIQFEWQVMTVLIKVLETYGRAFPRSYFSLIFEGKSTAEKKKELKARAKKKAEAEEKAKWKVEHKSQVEVRQKKKYLRRAEAIGRKRREKKGGDVDMADVEEEDGEGDGEDDGDGDNERDAVDPGLISKDTPKRIQATDIPRLRAPRTLALLENVARDSQFVNAPLDHTRAIQATGEAEHSLTPAATISKHELTEDEAELVEYVTYAPGANPAAFPQPALNTASGSPDSDQVSHFEETVIGWIVNEPSFGKVNFEKLAIDTPPGTPQHFDLPSSAKALVPSFRAVNTQDLFHDVRVFSFPNIECRAAVPVYVGNDYVDGGFMVGYGTLLQTKHRELMELSSRRNLADDRAAAPDKLDKLYLDLLKKLPQSSYIANLTLPAFIRSRDTNRALSIERFNKLPFIKEYAATVKQSCNDERTARQLQTESQTKRIGGEKAHRRNHPYLSGCIWPTREPIDNAQDGGGGPIDNAQDGGGGPIDNAQDGGGGPIENAQDGGGGPIENAQDGGGGPIEDDQDDGGDIGEVVPMEEDTDEIRGNETGEGATREGGDLSQADQFLEDQAGQGSDDHDGTGELDDEMDGGEEASSDANDEDRGKVESRKSKGKGKERAMDLDSPREDVSSSSPSESSQLSASPTDLEYDDSDDWEDFEEEVSMLAPPTLRSIGIKMPTKTSSWPYRRRFNPLFDSQLRRSEGKIKAKRLPIPQQPPPDPPLSGLPRPAAVNGRIPKQHLHDDFGCPYVNRTRSVQSAYREISVNGSGDVTTREEQLALKGAFSRTEESIRSTAVVAASATGKTVSKLLNILVSEEPHLLAKIGFKGFTMNSLVRNVAGLRAGFDEETGVAPAGEDAKSASEIDTTERFWRAIRRACVSEERSSGQKFRGRDAVKRLHLLSTFVTAFEQVIPARLKNVKPFDYLIRSLLSSPETTLANLDGFVKGLFPHHLEHGSFSNVFAELSSESAAIWSRLEANKRIGRPLVKLMVDFIVSENPREYVQTDPLRDWTDEEVPRDLSNAIENAFSQLSRRPTTLDPSLLRKVMKSQAALGEARDQLCKILVMVKRFLPHAYVELGTVAVYVDNEDDIRRTLHADDFLPVSHTLHALLTRTPASRPCAEFWKATTAFKLAILAIAGAHILNYRPTSCSFDASTTHRYVKIPEKQPTKVNGKVFKLRPALIDVLRDHLDNKEKAVRLSERALAAAASPPISSLARQKPDDDSSSSDNDESSSATPAASTPSSSNPPPLTLPPFTLDADEWIDEDQSEDPQVILSTSKHRPPRRLTRFLQGLIKRGRKAIKKGGTNPLDKTSNLANAFNKLKFLSSAERIAVLHHLAPDLKFVESLAGNPHYLLTNRKDRYGYARFVINRKLVDGDCRRLNSFYEAILPDMTPSQRDEHLNALRYQVLPMWLVPAQPGNILLHGYTRTPTTVNLLHIDPRKAKSVYQRYLPKPPKQKTQKAGNKKITTEEVPKKTFIDLVQDTIWDKRSHALKEGVVSEFVKTNERDGRGRVIYSQQLVQPLLDSQKRWTAAHNLQRRTPAALPSTVDPLIPRLLKFAYRDDDYPLQGINGKPHETDEEEEKANEVARQNAELALHRLVGPLRPNTIRVVGGNDAGKVAIATDTFYYPQSGECVTDIVKRNAFVGEDRTAQLVREKLSKHLEENERDERYRSVNPKLDDDKRKDGASKSIDEYNKMHPEERLSSTLTQPSQLTNVYNRERKVDHDREMRDIVVNQVNTLFPYVPGRTYQVSFFIGVDKLPKSAQTGRDLYSTHERMLCEEMSAREYIDLCVFMMPEAFTSSHCIYCDKSCVFHPDSLETGQPLPRLTMCRDCKKIFHRDALASQLYVQAAYLSVITGTFSFSPANEIGDFGREFEERLSDGERRRCRRTELELMAAYWARDYLRQQNNSFLPPVDPVVAANENEEDREAVRAEIEAPDEAEKLPKIRRTKVETLPEKAQLQGALSAKDRREMAAIEAQNPHLQAPTQDEESSD